MQLPKIDFSQLTLDNGLNVILCRQPKLPIVAANLWYHVGSKNEERYQRGFAHLFEHLMFEGSEHYPGDFFKHLQPLGANINGSTSSDRTNYFVDAPPRIWKSFWRWTPIAWPTWFQRSMNRSCRFKRAS